MIQTSIRQNMPAAAKAGSLCFAPGVRADSQRFRHALGAGRIGATVQCADPNPYRYFLRRPYPRPTGSAIGPEQLAFAAHTLKCQESSYDANHNEGHVDGRHDRNVWC